MKEGTRYILAEDVFIPAGTEVKREPAHRRNYLEGQASVLTALSTDLTAEWMTDFDKALKEGFITEVVIHPEVQPFFQKREDPKEPESPKVLFNPAPYPIVVVTWQDSQSPSWWKFRGDTIEESGPAIVVTTGYLVHECETYIMVAHSAAAASKVDPDERQVCGVLAIPHRSISEIVLIANPGAKVTTEPRFL